VICQLTQQLVQSTVERGVSETRELLKDWVVHLTACYHQQMQMRALSDAGGRNGNGKRGGGGGGGVVDALAPAPQVKALADTTAGDVDSTFSRHDNLQFLVRLAANKMIDAQTYACMHTHTQHTSSRASFTSHLTLAALRVRAAQDAFVVAGAHARRRACLHTVSFLCSETRVSHQGSVPYTQRFRRFGKVRSATPCDAILCRA
jgi:hypothetical protein